MGSLRYFVPFLTLMGINIFEDLMFMTQTPNNVELNGRNNQIVEISNSSGLHHTKTLGKNGND